MIYFYLSKIYCLETHISDVQLATYVLNLLLTTLLLIGQFHSMDFLFHNYNIPYNVWLSELRKNVAFLFNNSLKILRIVYKMPEKLGY